MTASYHPAIDSRNNRTSPFTLLAAAMVFAAILSGAGCSAKEPVPEELQELAPVHGRVTFQGKPTPGAILNFHPTKPAADPLALFTSAVVADDGTFTLNSATTLVSAAGAPPGDYKITVSWRKPIDPTERDSDLGPELVPTKYQDRATSGLHYEVKPGDNEIPTLELTP